MASPSSSSGNRSLARANAGWRNPRTRNQAGGGPGNVLAKEGHQYVWLVLHPCQDGICNIRDERGVTWIEPSNCPLLHSLSSRCDTFTVPPSPLACDEESTARPTPHTSQCNSPSGLSSNRFCPSHPFRPPSLPSILRIDCSTQPSLSLSLSLKRACVHVDSGPPRIQHVVKKAQQARGHTFRIPTLLLSSAPSLSYSPKTSDTLPPIRSFL